MKRIFWWFPLALLLLSCAPTPPPPAEKQPVDGGSLAEAVLKLPSAQVSIDPLRISYPPGALFSEGAALFYAGGPETLEPLAAVLLKWPLARWEGTVTAVSPVSAEHAQALAEVRSRLLRRYLQRKGVGADQLTLHAHGGEGADLELRLRSPDQAESAARSSLEKR